MTATQSAANLSTLRAYIGALRPPTIERVETFNEMAIARLMWDTPNGPTGMYLVWSDDDPACIVMFGPAVKAPSTSTAIDILLGDDPTTPHEVWGMSLDNLFWNSELPLNPILAVACLEVCANYIPEPS